MYIFIFNVIFLIFNIYIRSQWRRVSHYRITTYKNVQTFISIMAYFYEILTSRPEYGEIVYHIPSVFFHY